MYISSQMTRRRRCRPQLHLYSACASALQENKYMEHLAGCAGAATPCPAEKGVIVTANISRRVRSWMSRGAVHGPPLLLLPPAKRWGVEWMNVLSAPAEVPG